MVTTPHLATRVGSPVEYPAIMAANRTVGQMQEFNPDSETVTAYLERFQMFVAANGIEDAKLVPTLLTVVGSKHYSLIRGLVSPLAALPKDKSHEDLVTLLKKHYDPEPIVIAERFHFYGEARNPESRSQTIWQASDDWLSDASLAPSSQRR